MAQINQQALMKITGGDSDLLADVAVLFVRLLPDLKAETVFGVQNNELNRVENAAHQFRGRVGYFGAHELQEVASQLEGAAQKNEQHRLAELSEKLFTGVDQLLDELRALTNLELEVSDE